jgi:copper(I)-binding protein
MRKMTALLAGSLLAMSAMAADTGVTVSNAWRRATAQSSAGVWFSITSKQDAKLVAASSPLAGTTQLHTMSHEQGMMKMRAIESIALPAGKAVELAPGGDHVMLIDLKQPLKAGDHVPLKLSVQFADKRKVTLDVEAEVKPLGSDGQDAHQHMHMH